MPTPRKKRKKTGLEAVPTRELLKSIQRDLQKKLEELGFEGPIAAMAKPAKTLEKKRS